MFKQKLIPLMGAMLMLVSCGGNDTKIELDQVLLVEENETALVSKKVNIIKDATYNVHMNYGTFKDKSILASENALNMFCFCNKDLENLEIFDLIDIDSVTITYNDKELKKYEGTSDDWIRDAGETDNAKYKFTYIPESELSTSENPMALEFATDATVEKKDTDDIKFSFKAKAQMNDVYALAFPYATH